MTSKAGLDIFRPRLKFETRLKAQNVTGFTCSIGTGFLAVQRHGLNALNSASEDGRSKSNKFKNQPLKTANLQNIQITFL